jgi:hypothetical protein
MRHLCFIFLLLAPVALPAQQLIINELYNSSSSDEWVELLVVQDSLDLRGWDLRDFSSGGIPQDPLVFTSAPLWSALHAGTIIVVAKPSGPLEEDLDPLDHLLIVKTDDTTHFSGNDFVFAGSTDAIQIRAPQETHVFGISWGSGNAGSLPEPRVHFTESSTSNTSISFNEDSLPELTVEENWTRDDTLATPGEGNNTINSTWIESLRSGISGTGDEGSVLEPLAFSLEQNYPNPFNASTRIGYSLDKPGVVELRLYDMLGREVAMLLNERQPTGRGEVVLDATRFASGVYVYRLNSAGTMAQRKMVLLK